MDNVHCEEAEQQRVYLAANCLSMVFTCRRSIRVHVFAVVVVVHCRMIHTASATESTSFLAGHNSDLD